MALCGFGVPGFHLSIKVSAFVMKTTSVFYPCKLNIFLFYFQFQLNINIY